MVIDCRRAARSSRAILSCRSQQRGHRGIECSAVARPALVRQRQQAVGDAAQAPKRRPPAGSGPRANDLYQTPDRLRVGHRGAAELGDDHRPRSEPAPRSLCLPPPAAPQSGPPAPAAPRTVLCPSTTRRRSRMGQGRTRPTVTAMPPPRSRSSRGWGRSVRLSTSIGGLGDDGQSCYAGGPAKVAEDGECLVRPATRRLKPTDTVIM